MEPEDIVEQYPLIDAIDHDILMHRDIHFGGKFSIMIDYYQQGRKGVQPQFSIERIQELARLEDRLHQNLAAMFLSGSEMEKIAEAREAYKQLRAIYQEKKPASRYPRLIADLILAEDEEAKKEIQAIVAEKTGIISSLVELLRSETFYDPLFPGYGQSPILAARCLGLIGSGDKRAIISLFESFGHGDFFDDDQIIMALKAIGEPAKQFLLRVVAGHPITEDNERAAIALIQFKDDPEVAQACFKLLHDPAVQKDPCLPTYLILACEGLKGMPQQKEFMDLAKKADVLKPFKRDMEAIIHSWDSIQE